MQIILYADGGARGNPGPAAAGAVLFDSAGGELARLKAALGTATNNEAEYSAVIFGIQKARELGATKLEIRLDSKLIVEQLSGRWKIKEPRMRAAATKALAELAAIPAWSIRHVPREHNKIADSLVNAVLDAQVGPKKEWQGFRRG